MSTVWDYFHRLKNHTRKFMTERLEENEDTQRKEQEDIQCKKCNDTGESLDSTGFFKMTCFACREKSLSEN